MHPFDRAVLEGRKSAEERHAREGDPRCLHWSYAMKLEGEAWGCWRCGALLKDSSGRMLSLAGMSKNWKP